MHHTLRRFRVRRDLSAVWAFVSDLRNYEDWHPTTIAVHRLSGDGDVGTCYRRITGLGGVRSEMDFTVVTCVPGRHVGFRGRGAGVEILDAFELQAEAGEVEVVRRCAGRWPDDGGAGNVSGVEMEMAADVAAASLHDSVLHL